MWSIWWHLKKNRWRHFSFRNTHWHICRRNVRMSGICCKRMQVLSMWFIYLCIPNSGGAQWILLGLNWILSTIFPGHTFRQVSSCWHDMWSARIYLAFLEKHTVLELKETFSPLGQHSYFMDKKNVAQKGKMT